MNTRVCIPNIDIRRKKHFRNFFKNSKGFYDSNRIVYIYRVRLFDVKLEISLIWRGKRKKNLEERICDSLLLDTRQWITAERLLNDFVKSIKRSPDRVYARLMVPRVEIAVLINTNVCSS